MGEYEKEKEYPFEINEFYTPGLNSLKRIYTQHPKFNGNVRLIYELLFDHWNAKYGYAFPTIFELARESGVSTSTVERCINVLVELDLIKKKRSPLGNKINNVYIIKPPVATWEEFLQKFPEVEEHMKKRIAKIDAQEEKSLSKLKGLNKKPAKSNGKADKSNDNLNDNGSQVDYEELEKWL